MHITIAIATMNDAFQPDPSHEVSRIIRAVAACVAAGQSGGRCHDINGHTVGDWYASTSGPKADPNKVEAVEEAEGEGLLGGRGPGEFALGIEEVEGEGGIGGGAGEQVLEVAFADSEEPGGGA